MKELKKELNKKYSFINQDDIKITIKKSKQLYFVDIDYKFNEEEIIENEVKAALYTIDTIDNLIDKNAQVSYNVYLHSVLNSETPEKERITIYGSKELSIENRKSLEWSANVTNSEKTQKREIETTNFIYNIIKQWYKK